jgi:hypothetical protein
MPTCRRVGICVAALGCLLVGSALLADPGGGTTPPQGFPRFISREGTRLVDGEHEYRFVSFNVPNLLVIEDAFRWGGERPWRWPEAGELDDAFGAIAQLGGRAARSYVITVQRDDSDMGPFVHVTGPGQFNEQAFIAMDGMLAAANRARVRVIVPLVDNWKWQGGAPQYAAFRGKPAEAFWTDPEVIADFKKTIEHVLLRRNTITGVAYRDDRAILGWETGNELDSPPAWTREIAGFIKQLDPHHLVIDGNSLHGVPAASLDEPAIDVVTTHHYPEPNRDMVQAVGEAIAAAAGKKPFFVGEAGFVPLAELQRVADQVIESEAAGLLFWSLRFRSRDGGFYWHSEPAAQGRYKAFHWPGFTSGDSYDEAALLAFTHAAAHRILGLDPSPLPVPRTPEMLPVVDHGAISWRGSVGATQYVLERASAANGPWRVIAPAAREDHVQYRPLFADEAAEPGATAWYRVSAANAAGQSPASAAVGPVAVQSRVLVDELDDLSRVADHSTGVAIVTADARATQEDASRAMLPPGGSLAYQVDGRILRVRVQAFASDADARLAVRVGSHPPTPQPGRIQGAAGGDYGYLVPLEYDAEPDAAAGSVALVAGETSLQVSRVEIRWLDAATPDPP